MALSLPPDQQKRMGWTIVIRSFERIVYGRPAEHAAPLHGNRQRRGGVDTFRLAEIGRSGAAALRSPQDGHGCPVPLLKVLALVFACEAVVHSYAGVAAQGWETDRILVLLIEDVGCA